MTAGFKILHCSDLGLKNHKYGGVNPETGLNKRFEDVDNTMSFIVEKAIKTKCKYVIIAGDINEERNPESLLLERFSSHMKRLIDKKIRVILIAGNHDVDSSIGSSTSISHLKALDLPNLYIADKQIQNFAFQDDDIEFHCFPYMTKHMCGFNEITDMEKYLNEKISKSSHLHKWNILVAHYSTEKNFEGMDIGEARLKLKPMRRYDYVALGHIHQYEMYEKHKICGGYSGSIYKKDFGENESKYVNLVTIKDDVKYRAVGLPVREFIDLEIDARDCDHESFYEFVVNNLKDKIKDKIIKLTISVNKKFNPKPIYDFFRKEGVFHYLPIVWKKVRLEREQKIKKVASLSDEKIIKERLALFEELDNRFKKKVFNYCIDVIKKVKEKGGV